MPLFGTATSHFTTFLVYWQQNSMHWSPRSRRPLNFCVLLHGWPWALLWRTAPSHSPHQTARRHYKAFQSNDEGNVQKQIIFLLQDLNSNGNYLRRYVRMCVFFTALCFTMAGRGEGLDGGITLVPPTGFLIGVLSCLSKLLVNVWTTEPAIKSIHVNWLIT